MNLLPVLYLRVKSTSFVLMKPLVAVLLCNAILSSIPVADCLMRLPEFAEPIKNVTLAEGSDVEFSCDVKYLGTYRVAWSWKNGIQDDGKFLGIGIVKVTSNPRVAISRIQKSDDITQFNLYIYNIRQEDRGNYHCSVNSNPMIEQIGILDVIRNGNHESIEDENTTITDYPIETSTPSEPENTTIEDSQTQNETEETTAGGIKIFQNSTIICIDLNGMWESTRERISDYFSTLMKFTYSYWFS